MRQQSKKNGFGEVSRQSRVRLHKSGKHWVSTLSTQLKLFRITGVGEPKVSVTKTDSRWTLPSDSLNLLKGAMLTGAIVSSAVLGSPVKADEATVPSDQPVTDTTATADPALQDESQLADQVSEPVANPLPEAQEVQNQAVQATSEMSTAAPVIASSAPIYVAGTYTTSQAPEQPVSLVPASHPIAQEATQAAQRANALLDEFVSQEAATSETMATASAAQASESTLASELATQVSEPVIQTVDPQAMALALSRMRATGFVSQEQSQALMAAYRSGEYSQEDLEQTLTLLSQRRSAKAAANGGDGAFVTGPMSVSSYRQAPYTGTLMGEDASSQGNNLISSIDYSYDPNKQETTWTIHVSPEGVRERIYSYGFSSDDEIISIETDQSIRQRYDLDASEYQSHNFPYSNFAGVTFDHTAILQGTQTITVVTKGDALNLYGRVSKATVVMTSQSNLKDETALGKRLDELPKQGIDLHLVDKSLAEDSKADADKYNPQGQDVSVELGQIPSASDAVRNPETLPSGTNIYWQSQPDTSVAGSQQATVVISYPDQSQDTVDVTVTVVDNRSDADKYNPQGQDVSVELGQIPSASDAVRNPETLPAGTNIFWQSQPDTSVAGSQQATVVISYPDQNQDTVDVTVTVVDNRSDADKYNPQGQDVSVELGQIPSASDAVRNPETLPAGTNIFWQSQPDTSVAGSQQATVVISYPDQNQDTVDVTVTVVDNRSDADKYSPQGQDLTVALGQTPSATDAVLNASDLPAGTNIYWQSQPDTSQVGTQQATVVISYPDQSQDTVDVTVTVVDNRSDADRYNPQGQDVSVELGQIPSATDAVRNASDLPSGTNIYWQNQPDTSVAGNQQATVVISYPDQSQDTVDVTVTVVDNRSDADKYSPQGQDVSVELGQTPSASDAVSNTSELPSGTNIYWQSQPDTSVAGSQQATLVISYPDQSQDTLDVTVTVNQPPVSETPVQSDSASQSEQVSQAPAQSESVSETPVQSDSASQSEQVSQAPAQSESVSDVTIQSESQAPSESQSQSLASSESESQAPIQSQTQVTPVSETARPATSEFQAQPASETATPTVSESQAQPASESASQAAQTSQSQATSESQAPAPLASETPTQTLPSEVKSGQLIVNYIDNAGHVLAPSETLTGPEGDTYTTQAKAIDGYLLSMTLGDETGQFSQAGGSVTYVYKPVASYELDIPGLNLPDVPYQVDPNDPSQLLEPGEAGYPVIPYVAGYVPLDPVTNQPLTLVDPNDETKGYLAPQAADPNRRTVIRYARYVPANPSDPGQPNNPGTPSEENMTQDDPGSQAGSGNDSKGNSSSSQSSGKGRSRNGDMTDIALKEDVKGQSKKDKSSSDKDKDKDSASDSEGSQEDLPETGEATAGLTALGLASLGLAGLLIKRKRQQD